METLNKQFVPYTLALKLKELGFDEPCFGVYGRQFPQLNFDNLIICDLDIFGGDVKCKAPLWQQAFEWFREKYSPEELNFYINLLDTSKIPKKYLPCYTIRKGINVIEIATRDTYEEAQEACLTKLIEIVQDANK